MVLVFISIAQMCYPFKEGKNSYTDIIGNDADYVPVYIKPKETAKNHSFSSAEYTQQTQIGTYLIGLRRKVKGKHIKQFTLR